MAKASRGGPRLRSVLILLAALLGALALLSEVVLARETHARSGASAKGASHAGKGRHRRPCRRKRAAHGEGKRRHACRRTAISRGRALESEPSGGNGAIKHSDESAAAAGPTLFSASSFWNRRLGDNAQLSPKSATYVQELVNQVDRTGIWINTTGYSTPVYRVGPNQPTVTVTFEGSDPQLQKALNAVPIPTDAQPAAGNDRHMVIWQPSTDRMWEFLGAERSAGKWKALAAGAMENVSKNVGRFDTGSWPGAKTWWGATATSLPLLGGLMTISELEAGVVEHALAMAIPDPSPSHVWPAQRSDGLDASPNAIPEGTIFRLPPDLDLETLDLPPVVHAIAVAAQHYGIVVRDTSSNVTLYAEDPTPLGSNPYVQIFEGESPEVLLSKFPWAKLEAISPGQ